MHEVVESKQGKDLVIQNENIQTANRYKHSNCSTDKKQFGTKKNGSVLAPVDSPFTKKESVTSSPLPEADGEAS